MKSPIKENINNFCCLRALKEMIPPGSVVNSFLFFSGDLEFSLVEGGRFMVSHTNKFIIYDFWKCMLNDPHKIADIAVDLQPHLKDENLFYEVQESWPTYRDSFIRSAFFFLLNRCSESGLVSCGKLDNKKFNPFSISYIKKFKIDNFHIILDEQKEFIDSFRNIKNTDYLLFPIGKFSYNLFEYGKNKGYEMTTIHHKRFRDALRHVKDKWIVIYKHHPQVHKLYKDYNVTMLDKYGRETQDKEKCGEVVIANF